ncbi:hypothetical protein FAM09_01100 [Niastella caeni]|uniref:Peptidase M56 domain-containing protein n=1 Tax=Niastella caeni TaxID=2569763 RepID=A0A4S8HZD5_9BACT|nr:M56 family metallopeptidase [Niastella caeni]THU40741.1 hypothetical protein FAM09_01100 [Niastella caeni]
MLQYILKLTISLSIVYLFYQLFLRRLTFYNWNRWYLLIYSMVCFIIPFVNVFTIIVKQPALRESAFINYIPAITQMTQPAENELTIDWMLVTIIIIITGMLLMIVRLLIQYYSLFKMRSKAVLLYDDKVKLYHIDEPVIPFSFGRGIYVNQHQHSEQELKEIIRHEFIHVKQRHSLDIIWSELLCILNWYNPFAWLLRHDIRQNLEFIADQQVLQTGLDRKQYQYLLLKVTGVNSFSIAANFNFSSLKRRIAMMNKTKSARVHLIRFLFMLPLLVVVLLAFRNTTQGHKPVTLQAAVTDTLPKAPKEPPGWKEINTIDVTDKGKVTIRLKNGKTEKYDLTKPKEKEVFEQKYGPLPEPPAPPAVPSIDDREVLEGPEAPEAPELPEIKERPEAPEKPEKVEMPEAPEAPEAPEKAERPEMPLPPAAPLQDCYNEKGYCITVADNNGECVVIVKNRNKKIVEAVALTDWDKNKQYEAKYGKMPPPPPPVKKVWGRPKPVAVVEGKPVTIAKAEPLKEVVVIGHNVDANTVMKTATSNNVKPATVMIVTGKKMDAETAVSAKPVIRAKMAVSVKPVISAKTALRANPVILINSVDEVIVMGKKSDAKPVVSAKTTTAGKAKPQTVIVTGYRTIKLVEKAKPAPKAVEPQKQDPTQPAQDQ